MPSGSATSSATISAAPTSSAWDAASPEHLRGVREEIRHACRSLAKQIACVQEVVAIHRDRPREPGPLRMRSPDVSKFQAASRLVRGGPRASRRSGRLSPSASSTSCVTNSVVVPSSRTMRASSRWRPAPHDRIDRAERFVHQQRAGPRRDRARDADALRFAARELARPSIAITRGVEPDRASSSSTRLAISARGHPSSDGTTRDVLAPPSYARRGPTA